MLPYILLSLIYASLSVALPALIRYNDITRLNNDTTKTTNLDISETTETKATLQLVDLSSADVDLSQQLERESGELHGDAQSLLKTLQVADDSLKVLNIELTTTTTRDIDFDQTEVQDQDLSRSRKLEKTGEDGRAKKGKSRWGKGRKKNHMTRSSKKGRGGKQGS